MTLTHVQGLDFARQSACLSPTLFDATIAQRQVLPGHGFGAVYPDCDTGNVAFAHNATTDWTPDRCALRCGLFRWLIRGLSPPTTPQRQKPNPLHVRVRVRAHMHAYTVVALCRCASLYHLEMKEEKKGRPTTVGFLSVVGAVVALVKLLKMLNKRGF